jgi:tRNA pseudouridine55 synthase
MTNGILNINKPRDITSFQVVAQVKNILHERHVGHAGTLDPKATGVLPVCLGQATRIIEFLFDETKTYRAEIELGVTTDTYDSEGKVVRTADASAISREMIASALKKFKGSVLQTPPMFSAIKHRGKPLYELARSGIEIERKSRTVRIDSLEIVKWQSPVITLDIVCGKGTYIRSLAYDLGEDLGCGASLKSLIRLRVGPFSLEGALTLPQLEEVYRQGQLGKYLHPIDSVLTNIESVTVNPEQQQALINGAAVSLVCNSSITPGALRRAYTQDGRFIGMLKYDAENHQWRPEKIFLKDDLKQK